MPRQLHHLLRRHIRDIVRRPLPRPSLRTRRTRRVRRVHRRASRQRRRLGRRRHRVRLREHLILARGSLLGLQDLLRRDTWRARRGGARARLAGDVLHGAACGLRDGEGAGAARALAVCGLHLLQLLGVLLGLLSGWDLRDWLLGILRGCNWLSDGLWMRLPRLWLGLALHAESDQR